MIGPLPIRTLALILGLVALFVAALMIPNCVAKYRSQAAQARLGAEQSQAAVESGREASEAQAGVSANQAASEALGRSNEKDIRSAEGANAVVAAPVRDAGLASLCRRAAYRDRPKCRLLNAR